MTLNPPVRDADAVAPADSPLAKAFRPSPNFGERRGMGRPDCLILHYTGMPTFASALDLLTAPTSEVSCHYLVDEAGAVWRLVPEARRAWHAGIASWKGERDINSASIGVEIANPGHDGGLPPFPDAQIAGVIALARDILTRWSMRPERVLAHSDVAPARKRDPGELFPWETLFRAGVGHWAPPAPLEGGPLFRSAEEGPPIRAVQTLLALYGYGIELTGVLDRQTELALAAFQRHFRPARVDGLPDASTLKTLKALIEALVDSPST